MSGMELVRAGGDVFVNPVTGEIVERLAPDVDLARLLADIREHESRLRELKSLVNRELLHRMDFSRQWTRHLDGGMTLRAPSPKPVEEWDAAILREALVEFVDRGELPIEAVDAAVEVIVTYKVRKAGVTALRKGGGRVAETIEELCNLAEPQRYVSVS